MGVDTSGISCCFDEESGEMLKEFQEDGLGITSEVILAELSSRELKDSTVLELGCGVGALTLELLRNGASKAKGFDLSPKMVAAARKLASEAGLGASTDFQLGDGASAVLPESDVVILDTVLCCYPDVESLVSNSSSAARRYYAISLPDERRLLTRVFKVFLPLQGVFFRRGSFKFFIHPTGKLIGRLQAQGFRLVSDVPVGRIWGVLIFAAPSRA